jgi:hypothetical protein
MTNFGYTLMTEQSGPKELVRHAISAEERGSDFEVCSDHFSPWLASQGHAPNAWAVLGAVAHASERVDLYTYPSIRMDLRNAGAHVLDEEVVVDGNLITSRSPSDLPAFCETIIKQFAHATTG